MIIDTQGNPTQWQLFPRVGGQREAKHRHGGDQHARDDQVEEVVQGSPPDLDLESDVKVGLGTAVIHLSVSGSWNFWKKVGIVSIPIFQTTYPSDAIPHSPRKYLNLLDRLLVVIQAEIKFGIFKYLPS